MAWGWAVRRLKLRLRWGRAWSWVCVWAVRLAEAEVRLGLRLGSQGDWGRLEMLF